MNRYIRILALRLVIAILGIMLAVGSLIVHSRVHWNLSFLSFSVPTLSSNNTTDYFPDTSSSPGWSSDNNDSGGWDPGSSDSWNNSDSGGWDSGGDSGSWDSGGDGGDSGSW